MYQDLKRIRYSTTYPKWQNISYDANRYKYGEIICIYKVTWNKKSSTYKL